MLTRKIERNIITDVTTVDFFFIPVCKQHTYLDYAPSFQT